MEARRLLTLAAPYRDPLVLLAAVMAAAALVALAVPWLAGTLLGGIVEGAQDAGQQRWTAAILLLCLAATAMLAVASSVLAVRIDARILADLRVRMFEHVQRLPIGFHESRGKGDTLALMTYEVWRLGQFLTGTVAATPARLLMTIGAVAAMFQIDSRLALIVPLLIPLFYLVLKIIGRSLRDLSAQLRHAEAKLFELAEESLEMLPATKAFTREDVAAGRYREAARDAARLTLKQGRINAFLDPLLGLVTTVVAVFVLLSAGGEVRQGNMDAARLFSFIFYAGLLTRPIGALAHIYGEVQVARGTLERLQSVLDQPLEQSPPEGQRSLRSNGTIAFRGVRFAYPGREPVFEDLDLEIAAGERIALLGPNGSGKTALVNLLLRYHEPQAGSILLDGRSITTMNLAELRRQIGLVPQLPLLFNASIRDNIAFGAIAPGDAAIEQAAAAAQAMEFIRALPHGMDTMIGDRGVQLSGGQRQRIALARALIKDPPILVLDEATSMFDLEGEATFIAECLDAIAERTLILITHRPAIIALADRVVEIGDGRIIRSDRLQAPGRNGA